MIQSTDTVQIPRIAQIGCILAVSSWLTAIAAAESLAETKTLAVELVIINTKGVVEVVGRDGETKRTVHQIGPYTKRTLGTDGRVEKVEAIPVQQKGADPIVRTGETLVLGVESACDFLVKGSGEGHLVGPAKVQVSATDPGAKLGRQVQTFELREGKLYLSISPERTRGRGQTKVKTPVTLLGVTGTKLYAQVSEGREEIGVNEGSIKIRELERGNEANLAGGRQFTFLEGRYASSGDAKQTPPELYLRYADVDYFGIDAAQANAHRIIIPRPEVDLPPDDLTNTRDYRETTEGRGGGDLDAGVEKNENPFPIPPKREASGKLGKPRECFSVTFEVDPPKQKDDTKTALAQFSFPAQIGELMPYALEFRAQARAAPIGRLLVVVQQPNEALGPNRLGVQEIFPRDREWTGATIILNGSLKGRHLGYGPPEVLLAFDMSSPRHVNPDAVKYRLAVSEIALRYAPGLRPSTAP